MAIKRVSETDDKDLRNLILTNELGNQMLNMVAPIYDRSAIALYLFQAIGIVLEKETDFVYDFINQMFPQTTTWGISEWEKEYGIIPDNSKTIEQRRKSLLNVVFRNYSMTPKRIEQIVEILTGYECRVTENIAPNTILVHILGYVENLEPVKDELNRKVPAHLIYEIKCADLIEISTTDYSGFATTEFEHYELEVID